jgi:hypothetical protein
MKCSDDLAWAGTAGNSQTRDAGGTPALREGRHFATRRCSEFGTTLRVALESLRLLRWLGTCSPDERSDSGMNLANAVRCRLTPEPHPHPSPPLEGEETKQVYAAQAASRLLSLALNHFARPQPSHVLARIAQFLQNSMGVLP